MMRSLICSSRALLVAVSLLLGLPRTVGAQWNMARWTPGSTFVHVGAAVEPAAIGTFGAAHVMSVWRRPLQLRLEGSVVAGGADVADYGARFGGELPVVQRGALRLSLGAAAVHRGTGNTIFRASSFGADIQSQLGLYGTRAFAAVELGVDGAATTHLAFTDGYRRNFPEARDGWYAATSRTVRAGVGLGLTVASTELHVRGGVARAVRGDALIPPVYLSLGVGRRF